MDMNELEKYWFGDLKELIETAEREKIYRDDRPEQDLTQDKDLWRSEK